MSYSNYDDYQFEVKSGHEAMGKLIHEWSANSASRPRDIVELKAIAEKHGVELEVGKDVKTIKWLTMSYGEELSILLPPASLIDSGPGPGEYPIPDFYADLVFDGANENVSSSDRDKLKFSRIGEYTTQKCW